MIPGMVRMQSRLPAKKAGVGATIYWRDKTTGDVKSKEGAEGKALGHNYVLVEGEKGNLPPEWL